MSRRTADSNKAISVAWENEQQRVSEGKGTRDWTPEQQQDILERGKTYDDEGRAFRWHHMRSVSICPEEQGNPDNIQFLSHEEHIEAHVICWQPTNWYFDPVTKQRMDFGDGPIIPCKVIDLSAPVCVSVKECETLKSENKDPENKTSDQELAGKKNSSDNKAYIKEPVVAPTTTGKTTGSTTGNWFANAIDWAVGFYHRHKAVIDTIGKVAGIAAAAAVTYAASSSGNGHFESQDDCSDHGNNDGNVFAPSMGGDYSSPNRIYPETHASPQEHIVPGHGQHYHTKDGVIWKEKDPYTRGGNGDA